MQYIEGPAIIRKCAQQQLEYTSRSAVTELYHQFLYWVFVSSPFPSRAAAQPMTNVEKYFYRYSNKTETWNGWDRWTIVEVFLEVREALWCEISTVCLLPAQCFQSSQSGIFLQVFIFLLQRFDFSSTSFWVLFLNFLMQNISEITLFCISRYVWLRFKEQYIIVGFCVGCSMRQYMI